MESIAPQSQFNTLGALCDQALINLDLPVDHYFDKFLSWAFWGMKELNLDVFQTTKTALLPISDVKTVLLPNGYVDFCVVGIPSAQYFKTLSESNNLSLTERTLANANFGDTLPPGWLPNGISASGYGFFFNNFGGFALPQLGGGLPAKGFFRILEKNGCSEIYLDIGVPGQTIYLEYITSGFCDCDDQTVVNDYFSDYVLKFMNHKYESFLKPPYRSEAAITRTGRELWAAEMKVRGRKNDITPANAISAQRRAYRLTVKA